LFDALALAAVGYVKFTWQKKGGDVLYLMNTNLERELSADHFLTSK
jgi:hypothetical protein